MDNRLSQINATAQSFDDNGNLTAKGSDSFTWDFEDRLLQSSVAGNVNSYRYDGTGNRLSRTAAGSTTRFVLDLNGPLSRVLAETNTAGTISAWYVYGLGLVERVGADGSVRFYHHDSRGSTVALSDNAGNLTDRYAYDPFGQLANASGATPNPFKYVGRFGLFDEANGLIYIRARYYDPGQGRFLSKDPKPGNETETQSLNRFVYGMNNPIGFVDLNGLSRSETGRSNAGGDGGLDRDTEWKWYKRYGVCYKARRVKEDYELSGSEGAFILLKNLWDAIDLVLTINIGLPEGLRTVIGALTEIRPDPRYEIDGGSFIQLPLERFGDDCGTFEMSLTKG